MPHRLCSSQCLKFISLAHMTTCTPCHKQSSMVSNMDQDPPRQDSEESIVHQPRTRGGQNPHTGEVVRPSVDLLGMLHTRSLSQGLHTNEILEFVE